MKTITKFLCLIIALLMVLPMVLVGCGKDPVETTPPAQSESTSESVSESESETESETETSGIAAPDQMEDYTSGAVTSGDASYAYKTPTGDLFNATGTFNEGVGSFSFAKDSTLVITPAASVIEEPFYNKVKISYKSSSALKVIITYTDGVFGTGEGGTAITDTLYLESGKHMFTFLTASYLYSKFAKDITSIEIIALEGDDAEFTLYDVNAESIEFFVGGQQHVEEIENERYILGIKMGWGGAISSLVDKNDGIEALESLINCSDAGRLIQQSYYGTSDVTEYKCGEFNGEVWGYNPVQGGSKHNTSLARIIDYKVNGDGTSLYIKAQPCDWANHGCTPSYMENTYTLYSNRIQVDNRFVDFAGYKYNPTRAQELPAVYTVSYLDSFVYYNGANPWTNDELTFEHELENWAQNPSQSWPILEQNTETWCAWFNSSASDPSGYYGLGVYTPNADVLYAGRYDYDGSMDPRSGSCGYVTPISNLKIVNYKPFEYSYLLTTGSVDEIRATFTEHRNFASNDLLHSKEFGYVSARQAKNPIKGTSFDTFGIGDSSPKGFVEYNGGSVMFGAALVNNISKPNGTLTATGVAAGKALTLSGWIGYLETAIDSFGYYFDGDFGEAVTVEAKTPEDLVCSDNFGGQYAKRFNFTVDTSSLSEGEHTVIFFSKLANGDIEELTVWTVTMLGAGEDCDHKKNLAPDELGAIICMDCGTTVITPVTHLSGNPLRLQVNNDHTTPGVATYNNDGYMTITGGSTAADPGTDKVLSFNCGDPVFQRYLVMTYRTSDAAVDLRFVTWDATTPLVVFSGGTSGKWQTVVIDLKADSSVGHRIDIRANIGTSENGTTDISRFATFATLAEANAYCKALSGNNSSDPDCAHDGNLIFSANCSIVCSKCEGEIIVPDTYIAGSLLQTLINPNQSAAGSYTYNNDGYMTISGASASADPGMDKRIAYAQSVQRYLVLRYKTSEPDVMMRLVTYGAIAEVVYMSDSADDWKIILVDLGNPSGGVFEIRTNIGGGADMTTDISHIITFADYDDALAYTNIVSMMNYGKCYQHLNLEEANDGKGSLRCLDCGFVITPVTYQSGAALGSAIDSANTDNGNVTDNGAMGVTVNRTGTGLGGATAKVSFTSADGYGKYVVLVYKSTSASGLIGITTKDDGSYGYKSDMAAADVWTAYCYGYTGAEIDRVELLLNYGDANATTSLLELITFDSLESAMAYSAFINTLN